MFLFHNLFFNQFKSSCADPHYAPISLLPDVDIAATETDGADYEQLPGEEGAAGVGGGGALPGGLYSSVEVAGGECEYYFNNNKNKERGGK